MRKRDSSDNKPRVRLKNVTESRSYEMAKATLAYPSWYKSAKCKRDKERS